MNWARLERQEFADALAAAGPDAPTLCEGWTTRDLAAHIVLRERRPDAAAGILFPPLADYTARVQQTLAAQPWDQLIDEVREGPPRWTPMAFDPLDRAFNTVEFFVHHEDIRRAQPGWTARELDRAFEADLWERLQFAIRLLARRSPVGLVLKTPDGDQIRAKQGEPVVTVTGPASELTLFMSGRQSHALVDVDAPDDTAALVRTARLGL
jgi:uncharacterized protein (TIGR03085 family)